MVNIDFAVLIDELKEAGINQKTLADRVGCSEFIISRLKSKDLDEPKYSPGHGIVLMHKHHVENAPIKKAAKI